MVYIYMEYSKIFDYTLWETLLSLSELWAKILTGGYTTVQRD